MKLIIIFGPQAVGKMTIGHELEKITSLKLFHNHMPIELVSPFFSYSTETGKKLVKLIREEIFKEVASSDLEGLVFTYLWYFDEKKDWDYLENLVNLFKDKGAEIYYVELEADTEERIRRNKTEHRLEHKPTKRNIEWSENNLKKSELEHRLNSKEGEIKEKNYIRINNTNLSPEVVAQKIKETFNL
ncbi:MAG: AAA family ATPase [Patescibacteria group bacterium]